MPRIKKVNIDGAEFVITPLTMAQDTAWKAAPQPDPTDTNPQNRYLPHFRDVICPSLNNALPVNTPQDQLWTPERCYNVMDLVLALKLYEEVLTFTGYKLTTKEGLQAEGEALGTSTPQPSDGSSQENAVGA